MPDTTKKRFALGYLITAAVFFAAGMAFVVYGMRLTAQVNAKLATNTLQLTADLSKAGEYKGRFAGIEHFGLDYGVFIDFDEPVASKAELAALTGDIEGKWISSDSMLNQDFECWDLETFTAYPKSRFSLLWLRHTRPPDGSEVTLAITKPSAAMAGRHYRIVGNYVPCGMEFLSASLCALSALVLWLIAVIFLIVWAVGAIVRRTARKRAGEL